MRTAFLDWTTRLVMLALAGLVTLSILGSIAAMSEDDGRPRGTGAREQPVPAQEGERPVPQTSPPPAAAPEPQVPEPSAGVHGVEVATGTAAVPEEEDETDRWLEAIAYALLALAGLAAIGLLLLWQAVRQLRRAADSAEAQTSEARFGN